MKIYCCYTPAHRVLFDRFFQPSIPFGFSLHPLEFNITGAGDFLSREFLSCIHRKVDAILESLRTTQNELMIWSDVDIQCVSFSPQELQTLLEQSGADILFQRDAHYHADVNTGFFICKSTPELIEFFSRVADDLRIHADYNEQRAINLLLSGSSLKWGYLPWSFYARSHGWPPPRRLAIYHANDTMGAGGVKRKIQQLEELNALLRYGWPYRLWTCVKKAPRRIRRLLWNTPSSHGTK